jgi:hypothetical protein
VSKKLKILISCTHDCETIHNRLIMGQSAASRVTKSGGEVAFAARKENEMIRCLGFWVKVILPKIVEPEVKCCLVVTEIIGRRRKEQSRTKTFEMSVAQHLRWKLQRP